jgi:anti-anti-sigma factor
VVHVRGELDVATRDALIRECLTDRHKAVVVEMAEMSFMDCSGYGGLIAVRQALELRHGSLTLINHVGQPAQLFALISTLEQETALSES